jgi:ribose transport system substrate-binding protein
LHVPGSCTFGGIGGKPVLADVVGRSEKPLKAAFSNAGLQAAWCAQDKQAAARRGEAVRHRSITWDNAAGMQWMEDHFLI